MFAHYAKEWTLNEIYCEACSWNQHVPAEYTLDGIYLCEKHARFYEAHTPDITVCNYFHLPTLEDYLTSSEEWFKRRFGLDNVVELGTKEVQSKVTNAVYNKDVGYYIYVQRGAKILAVAHLDKAAGSNDRRLFRYGLHETKNQHFVFNGNLDDRLGAYVICEVFSQLGIEVDLLLTTNEESGGTTASYFLPPEGKEYNWIIEFDRHDVAAVMYQYHSGEWANAVKKHTTVDFGSFSDISVLDSLGVKAVNWGTAYYREHTREHYAVLDELEQSINRFKAFYDEYKDTKFIHDPNDVPETNYWGSWADESYWYKRFENTTTERCDLCSTKVNKLLKWSDTSTGEFLQVCKPCWFLNNGYDPSAKIDVSTGAAECDWCTKALDKRYWQPYKILDGGDWICASCWFLYNGIYPEALNDVPRLPAPKYETVCDVCGKQVAYIILQDDKDMCYSCFMGRTQKEMCGFCMEKFDSRELLDERGVKVCPACYNANIDLFQT